MEDNSELIWKIWKKGKSNSEKMWKIWSKGKLKSEIKKKIVKRQGKYRGKVS